MKQYFVYIMASKTRRTYIGMTSALEQRVWQHKEGVYEGHTKQYNKHRLVYIEEYPWALDATARERQLKKWSQAKKVTLVESQNPEWNDLSEGWYE
jgi:putative endonuclease